MISLRELTKENYLDCIRLNLHPDQEENLASNAITIAQSRFETDYRLKVIYEQETVIGLLAFCHEDEPLDYSIYWLFRFMIDKDHQNKGYGKQVLSLLVEEVQQLGGTTLLTMPNQPISKRESYIVHSCFMKMACLMMAIFH